MTEDDDQENGFEIEKNQLLINDVVSVLTGSGRIFGLARAARSSAPRISFFFLPASTCSMKTELATRQAKMREKAVVNFMIMAGVGFCWVLSWQGTNF